MKHKWRETLSIERVRAHSLLTFCKFEAHHAQRRKVNNPCITSNYKVHGDISTIIDLWAGGLIHGRTRCMHIRRSLCAGNYCVRDIYAETVLLNDISRNYSVCRCDVSAA